MRHLLTIPNCPEAGGMPCAQAQGRVFAAARGAGRILVIGTDSDRVLGEFPAGTRPNGLAWDKTRRRLFVADAADNKARFIDPESGTMLGELQLRGRPRWALHHRESDVFLVNIRDPAGVEVVSPDPMPERDFVPISVQGPHGLELDGEEQRAFVACDGRQLVVLALAERREVSRIPLSGEPDVIWRNAKKELLYCPIGRPGVIDVIDTRGLNTVGRGATEEGAHTLTFDNERQILFSLQPKSQQVAIYREE